jgi:outer membrane lipoprotein-sorting protein
MKKAVLGLIGLVATSLFLAGCTAVSYHKQVVTTLDNKGEVVSTVITESITEPHSEGAKLSVPGPTQLKHIGQ